jgi:hypothetical protein
MGFKSMEFGATHGAVAKTHQSPAFEFSPAPAAMVFTEQRQDSYARASRNKLDVGNLSDDLKVHPVVLLQTLLNNPSLRLTYSVYPPKLRSNQGEEYWHGSDAGIKRVGLNRGAAVQFRPIAIFRDLQNS